MQELIILDRKITNVKCEIDYYKKQNKRIKLYYARKRLKRLNKQYKILEEKIEGTNFWKK